MLPGLDCVLLGGQTERVVAHRVQDVLAVHALIASEDVGADVAERVTDVQTGAARVREHVEHEHRIAIDDFLGALREQARRVRGPEGVIVFPSVLPAGFNLVGQARVVPVARNVVR